jgi:hypothetical protein
MRQPASLVSSARVALAMAPRGIRVGGGQALSVRRAGLIPSAHRPSTARRNVWLSTNSRSTLVEEIEYALTIITHASRRAPTSNPPVQNCPRATGAAGLSGKWRRIGSGSARRHALKFRRLLPDPRQGTQNGTAASQRFVNHSMGNLPWVLFGGDKQAMDDLPNWASSIIAVAVGLLPGFALLSARPIARLLYRVLWPRPVEAPQSRREPAHGEPAGVAVSRG